MPAPNDVPETGLGLLAQVACIWEATARKVGNVHRSVDFAGTSYLDFLLSAAVIGWHLEGGSTEPVGRRIRDAVAATYRTVGTNTNLGILLLLVPLASGPFPSDRSGREQLNRFLQRLTVQDTRDVYEAIRLVNPGGLGDAPEQDVRDEPTVTLLEAMTLAADRDQIARQYATGFADVFDFGVPVFRDAFARFGTIEAAIVDSQLRWLEAYPDSLIARKCGSAIAEDVRQRAAAVQRLGGIATPAGRRAGVSLDRYLRSDGNRLNPGTTADLMAACLFVALREDRVKPSAPFHWNATDWL